MDSLVYENFSTESHFECAIKSNKNRLFNKLVAKSENYSVPSDSIEYFHVIISLIDEIYSHLRSPISSNHFIENIAQNLIENSTNDNNSIHLTAVLASPTAAKEIDYFMRFFDIFNHYKIKSFISLLFIHWEDEADTDVHEGYEDFTQRLFTVSHSLKNRTGFKIFPIHPRYQNFSEPRLSELNKKFYKYMSYFYANIMDEKHKHRHMWNKDKEWITNFYKRQESFKDFSSKKALYDLAMRRAIGRLEREVEFFNLGDNPHSLSFLLTSELNKRFLACYDSYNPILNIEIKK